MRWDIICRPSYERPTVKRDPFNSTTRHWCPTEKVTDTHNSTTFWSCLSTSTCYVQREIWKTTTRILVFGHSLWSSLKLFSQCRVVGFVLPWCAHDVEIRKKKKCFTVRFRTTWNVKALCVFWSRHDSMGGRDTYVPLLAQKIHTSRQYLEERALTQYDRVACLYVTEFVSRKVKEIGTRVVARRTDSHWEKVLISQERVHVTKLCDRKRIATWILQCRREIINETHVADVHVWSERHDRSHYVTTPDVRSVCLSGSFRSLPTITRLNLRFWLFFYSISPKWQSSTLYIAKRSFQKPRGFEIVDTKET